MLIASENNGVEQKLKAIVISSRHVLCYKDDSSGQPKTKKSFGHPYAVDTTPNHSFSKYSRKLCESFEEKFCGLLIS